MKTFRAVTVLRRPRAQLWRVVRDHLTDLTNQIADVDRIIVIERSVEPDGRTKVINEWYVRQQLPAFARSILGGSEIGWIDRNFWDERVWTCSWSVEPFFLKGSIDCAGTTRFETAMANQGTRVIFEGNIDLKRGLLSGSLASLERPVIGLVESIVTTIIPRNLQRVFEAAASYGD